MDEWTHEKNSHSWHYLDLIPYFWELLTCGTLLLFHRQSMQLCSSPLVTPLLGSPRSFKEHDMAAYADSRARQSHSKMPFWMLAVPHALYSGRAAERAPGEYILLSLVLLICSAGKGRTTLGRGQHSATKRAAACPPNPPAPPPHTSPVPPFVCVGVLVCSGRQLNGLWSANGVRVRVLQ